MSIKKRERQQVEPFVSFDSYDPKTSRPRSSNEYDVEAILDRKGKKFLIKWQGYPASEATWEPAQACVGCIDLLVRYLTTEGKSKAAKVKTVSKKVKKKKPAAKDVKKKATKAAKGQKATKAAAKDPGTEEIAAGIPVDGIPKPRGRPPVRRSAPFPPLMFTCTQPAAAASPIRSLLVARTQHVLITRRAHAGGENLELD